MHRITGWLLAALLLILSPAWAQPAPDLTGQWQGTVNVGAPMRLVVTLVHGDGGALTGRFQAVEPAIAAVPLTELVQSGDAVKFSHYRGQSMDLKLSADRQSLAGNYLAGGVTIPVTLARATPATAWPLTTGDTTAHKTQMVKVADNVELEVVDWGGSGRPLVFLSGLGQTAHVFDAFAPRFTSQYRVIGITRRGFGASSKPDAAITANYRTQRLGDDVLAVMDALKLDRPVLAGWSIAGGELSSVASRHPEKVAGLVYLDAASHWAFYTPGLETSLLVSSADLREKLAVLTANPLGVGNEAGIDRIISNDLPNLLTDLRAMKVYILETRKVITTPPPAPVPLGTAIFAGAQKFGPVGVPVLALFAIAQAGPETPASLRPVVDMSIRQMTGLADAYEKGNPKARVVRIIGGRHDIFTSHPDAVTREMNAFMASLRW